MEKIEFALGNETFEYEIETDTSVDEIIKLFENYIKIEDKDKLKKELSEMLCDIPLKKNESGCWVMIGDQKKAMVSLANIIFSNCKKKD